MPVTQIVRKDKSFVEIALYNRKDLCTSQEFCTLVVHNIVTINVITCLTIHVYISHIH